MIFPVSSARRRWPASSCHAHFSRALRGRGWSFQSYTKICPSISGSSCPRNLQQALGADATITPLWPHNKRYAITLNHDIDTDWGIRNALGVEAFREAEEERGLTSAWLAVANLQDAGRECFNNLRQSGHEIGCHGTVHDHAIAVHGCGSSKKEAPFRPGIP